MQKRYCPCGRTVWVEYLFSRQTWIARLHAPERDDRREIRVGRCAGCGRPLNIDRLQ